MEAGAAPLLRTSEGLLPSAHRAPDFNPLYSHSAFSNFNFESFQVSFFAVNQFRSMKHQCNTSALLIRKRTKCKVARPPPSVVYLPCVQLFAQLDRYQASLNHIHCCPYPIIVVSMSLRPLTCFFVFIYI